MSIIDTHLHLIHPEQLTYPWLANVPALDRPHRLDDYGALAESLGIAAALHMEVDVAETEMEAETRFVLGLGAPVVGAVAACRPERADFAGHLETLAAMPGVKGLRRILHTVPDGVSQTALFAGNIRRLAEHGLTFDLCLLARQLPIGRALVSACPDVVFVLDHCGNPDIASGDLGPWRTEIAALAALPNVVAKLSGVATNAAPDWTVEDLRPVADHLLATFGPDRIVWGSDMPVLTLNGDLARWVEATHGLLSGCSSDEKARILSENARRIYRL